MLSAVLCMLVKYRSVLRGLVAASASKPGARLTRDPAEQHYRTRGIGGGAEDPG
jgi:hypothetical protein